MASWTDIANALVAVGAKPFSSTLQALRDNPIAIAEQDPSVPLNLRIGHWLLGTVITASGLSQSLTSLNLTPYRFLKCVVNGVSMNAGSSLLLIDGQSASAQTATAAGLLYGVIDLDLATGVFGSSVNASDSITSVSRGGDTSYSTATTTITFSSLNAFDAGSIRVYGVK